MGQDYEKVLAKCFEKVNYMNDRLDGFPHITRKSSWLTNQNGHWTGGFWIGLLWLERIMNDDSGMDEMIKNWAMKLRCRMDDTSTHDQGFIFGPSCVLGYRVTGDDAYLPLIHAGAENLIKQYIPETGLIRAWGESGYDGISIVDTIMNIPLLWISGELLDDPTRKELCLGVGRRIHEHAVRADYSTYHVVRLDKDYNIYGDTHQGFSADSCWSRGQAWALYGFANMYRYTGETEFLETAIKIADYYWEHLNDDLMPAWDFNFRNDSSQPIDAAASSIACAGMALISEMCGVREDTEAAKLWGERADRIIGAETNICLFEDMDRYGIIRHATVDLPRKSGVDESAMYGDYYFAEALYRRINKDSTKATSLLY